MDQAERELLAETLRKTMTAASGRALDSALADLGWAELLAELPDVAVPLTFRLLGETGAHAPLLNDVLLRAAGRPPGGTTALPYTGGAWVRWERDDRESTALDGDLPLRILPTGDPLTDPALAAGRRALGWWLLGTGRAMLALARTHVLDRTQFGRPLSSFQAVRHRLAETLVDLEGAEATLLAAEDGLGSLLAKAAAGRAALTAARHCQQVLGGIGFTAEHGLHRHVRRTLVLDGLLGSARELTREVGALLRESGTAPRLIQL
ncbi:MULTISPECIES: acyl-CoA dehydrogenase family protein [Streptacidiphilus]|uniref:Acyl-CoA dehydrogenase family protein n=1 Tax=Streptacidiphilus cavernicola TaxID=3342716 RepID=A0ABV6UIS0_9ACTN|nr:acyl-CoA dehydrogenase family protein [Streptacidiphilus jeojiense]